MSAIRAASPQKSTALVVQAFLAIYLLWGTTFLAIRIAVHELPPLFAAGTRFFVAGTLLFAFLRLRGTPSPTKLQWRNLALVGALMFVADYSALFWAEKFVSSGISSVLAATIPLLTIALEIFVFRQQPFRLRLVVATLLGFGGVAILLLPTSGQRIPVIPCLAILAGSTCFALGGVLNRGLQLPASKPLTSGASMMLGGAALLMLSAACGELHPFPHISLRAALALAYLIVFGSLVAFTAYLWLLDRMPATRVNSYAYINPIVAVALGYSLIGEVVDLRMVAGAALILISVFLILREPKPA